MDLGQLLLDSGAMLKGHFLLASGRHSDTYVEKFRVLEQPEVLSALCSEISDRFSDQQIDAVAGPTTGGIIIAFEVARQMGLPAIYVESESGQKKLRRNKTLAKGLRVLLVDDVLTTGGSLVESAKAISEAGGVVVGYGVLIDRTQSNIELGAPLFGAYRVEAASYTPEEVPPSLGSVPITKPGTSQPIG